jgi:phosphoribosylaminoimidazolecarboxamide formyltransferase/IMP cyclohydrolase
MKTIRRALISVSDKEGIVPFAGKLSEFGFEIISTGGTYKLLKDEGIPVKQVSEITGFPEIMDGRVKTLNPYIHGGILANRSIPAHMAEADNHKITMIDIVVVNLYPFEKTLRNPVSTHEEIIENIDIGGPTMLRSAAKNYHDVTVVTDPGDYAKVIAELESENKTTLSTREYLAFKTFRHTADYDTLISGYFSSKLEGKVKGYLQNSQPLLKELRYGENPHQAAGFYSRSSKQLVEVFHGKELSYNNYLDIDAALKLIAKFDNDCCVAILKHTNPCGIGTGKTIEEAYRKAFATDTSSPFGGIVITNQTMDLNGALAINEVFTEIIIAPAYTEEAETKLKKKKDRRLLTYSPEALEKLIGTKYSVSCLDGFLSQDLDLNLDEESNWRVVTERKPTDDEMKALTFGWKTVATLKSNAVCFTTSDRTIGLGIGQTSRIDSTEIAIRKAAKFGLEIKGTICASDGFFPFRDSIDAMHELGVTAIIQPGGSKGDQECIDACNEFGIAMILTGMRHFRH